MDTLRSPVRVQITEASGRTRSLDGALAVHASGDLRLKLWRGGRDVLELMRVDGVSHAWIDPRVAEASDAWSVNGSGNVGRARTNRDGLTRWIDALSWFLRPSAWSKANPFDALGSIEERPAGQAAAGVVATRQTFRIGEVAETFDATVPGVVDKRPVQGDAWSASLGYDRDDAGRAGRVTRITLNTAEISVSIQLRDPVWNAPLPAELFVRPARMKPLSVEHPGGQG